MELLSSSKNPFAKFLRIQRSISTFPALVVYSVVGLYFTGSNFFHLHYLLGALALYLLGVAVNGYNNLFDIEEDKLAASRGIVKANYLLAEFSMRQLTWNFVLTSIALVCVLLLIGNLEFAVLCAFSYALGVVYTRPIRLKNRPLIGTVSNTYGFSIFPILSCFFLLNGELTATIAFSLAIVLPAFANCLIAEIADREIDRKIGTRTTACWLGTRAKTVLQVVMIGSIVLYFVALYVHWAVVLVTPFLVVILYGIYTLFIDFTDKMADYVLLKIGANISLILVVYIIVAIILHVTNTTLPFFFS